MLKKILKIAFTSLGLVLGYIIGKIILRTEYIQQLHSNTITKIIFLVFCIILFGFILFLLSPKITSVILKSMEYIERSLQRLPANDVIFGTAGAIIGLIVSALFVNSFKDISIIWTIIAIVISIIMAAIGANIAIRRREDITSMFSNIRKINYKEKKQKVEKSKYSKAKVLDTSVIIDGRIFDICKTGFIEGTLVIPNFVLEELRHIADSSDGLKRNRGRRGLDILNKIQKELNMDVEIYEKDFPDIAEVDSKLLKLTQILKGHIITNDYNLNKVAEFQKVPVLNINELSNAVKPVVLPGEEMSIQIVKDGKESNQGVAYLDDGTMIVVEGGKKHIGENMKVIVTSVLQTAAGRMIFAKQKN